MPTPRSNRADIAQKILDQATRLFAAHGFSGVSLADIAKSVGIRKPSLLYHFQSKDTLRRSVLEEILAHWNDVLPKLLMAATSGSEQFDTVLSKTVSFFADEPDRARLILRELLDRPDEMQPLIETHVRPWATIVADYIRRGQQAGRLRLEVDPQAYVAHMTMLVISSLATFETVAALVPEADHQALLARHTTELLRIAKTSLFRQRPVQTAASAPASPPTASNSTPANSAPEPHQETKHG
ncbi:MAG: TetR/AcrR family transcriptional regulator [Cyanobacteria bacterium HKST-UBA02]|nr:TetR/AcrR family transcriptional regulator [Myxococcales bacterium]MCA9802895.1 TetR/AcrR family transcriptional regulator [Cyanobacteria bacterium HKST-UBA02]